MSTSNDRRAACLSLAEFTDLVSAAFDSDVDHFDPERALKTTAPDQNEIETSSRKRQQPVAASVVKESKSDSGTGSSRGRPSCFPPSPSSSSATRSFISFKPQFPVSASPSAVSRLPFVNGIGRKKARPQVTSHWEPSNTFVTWDASSRYSPTPPYSPFSSTTTMPTPSISTVSMSTLDAPGCVGLAMTAGVSNGRKPLALLQKIKRQASALVKPSTPSPDFPSTSTTTPHSNDDNYALGLTTGATSRAFPDRTVPTVSFAPTPAHSVSAFSSSTSLLATSAKLGDDDSFLDTGGSKSAAFRQATLKHGKSMPALKLFRNRNTHFIYHGAEGSIESQDDVRSFVTTDTTETGTGDATSTESGDYIPYIPLVLQHERATLRARASQIDLSQSSQVVTAPAGRKTSGTRLHARSTPSPTPSCSDTGSGSESTRSPITPKTSFFARCESITPSVTNSDDDGDDGSSIVSSFISPNYTDVNPDNKGRVDFDQAWTGRHSKLAPAYPLPPLPSATFPSLPQSPLAFHSRVRKVSTRVSARSSERRHPYAQTGFDESEQQEADEWQDRWREEERNSFVSRRQDPIDDDRNTIDTTTSESCYSAESHLDIIDLERRQEYSLKVPELMMIRSSSSSFSATNGLLDEVDNQDNHMPRAFEAAQGGGSSSSSERLQFDAKPSSIAAAVHVAPPPDIRVETASVVSEIPTLSAAAGFVTQGLLHPNPQPMQPTKPRYQPQIGVGRQTADPRRISQHDGGGKPENGQEEWTLLLGVGVGVDGKDEDIASRKRTASASSPTTTRVRTKSATSPRMRTKSEMNIKKASAGDGEAPDTSRKRLSSSSVLSSSSLPLSMPFLPEEQVQKPLRRMQAFVDVEILGDVDDGDPPPSQERDENAEIFDREEHASPALEDKGKDRVRDRTVSARTHAAPKTKEEEQVDWTLMLPLPLPKSKSKSNFFPVAEKPASVPHGITRARSSVDVSSGMKEWERKGEEKPLFSSLRIPKNPKRRPGLEKLEKPAPAEDLSSEQMLAALVDCSKESNLDEGRSSGSGSDEVNESDSGGSEKERDDHRRKALDALSGCSSPSSSPSETKAATPPSSSSSNLLVPSAEHIHVSDPHRSLSPSPSVAQFEARLTSLLAAEAASSGGQDQAADKTKETDLTSLEDGEGLAAEPTNNRIETIQDPESSEGPEQTITIDEAQVQPSTSTPTTPSFLSRPVSRTAFLPFPSVLQPCSSPCRRPYPFAPIASLPGSGSSTPPRNSFNSTRSSLSLSSRAPIGVSQMTGLSFSQHRPAAGPGGYASFSGRSRTPSAIVFNSTRPLTSPSVVTLPEGLHTPRKPSAVSMSAITKRPSIAVQPTSELVPPDFKPIPSPSTWAQKGDDDVPLPSSPVLHDRDDRLSRTASFSSVTSSLSVASSSSSTTTVVPSEKRSDEEQDTRRSSDSFDDRESRMATADFPMPPTHHSAALVRTFLGTTSSANGLSKRVVSRLTLTQASHSDWERRRLEVPSTPVLGADEDIELPPPTPTLPSSGPSNSPHVSQRTSPAPKSPLDLVAVLDAVDSSTSQWLDDDDEDEDEQGQQPEETAQGWETDYEDAVSTLSISEEEYEDAVSMLSGVFYSARSSFDV